MLVFVSLQNLSLFLETTFTSVCFFFLFFLFFSHRWGCPFLSITWITALNVFFSQAQKTTSGTITRCHDQLGRPQDRLIAKTGLQDVFFLVLVPGNGKLDQIGGLGWWSSGIQTTNPNQQAPNHQLAIGWLLCLFKWGGGVPIVYQLPREKHSSNPLQNDGFEDYFPWWSGPFALDMLLFLLVGAPRKFNMEP